MSLSLRDLAGLTSCEALPDADSSPCRDAGKLDYPLGECRSPTLSPFRPAACTRFLRASEDREAKQTGSAFHVPAFP